MLCCALQHRRETNRLGQKIHLVNASQKPIFEIVALSWRAGGIVFGYSFDTISGLDMERASVAISAETPLRSPRTIFIFVIKKYTYRIKVSEKQID